MLLRNLSTILLLLMVLSAFMTNADAGRRRKEKHHDSRVYDSPTSDAEHDDDDDDDDAHHDDRGDRDHDDDDSREGDDDHHDSKYDHESFLGKEDSRKFDEMKPDEAKEKLGEIFVKIDTNKDLKISPEELQAWLAMIGKLERARATETRFHNMKAAIDSKDVDGPMSWEEYKKALHQEVVGDDTSDKHAVESYNTQVIRDEKRWAKADADGDKLLSKMEFADFIHPEEAPHMKDIVITEAMLNTDKNKDGKIDLNEFMTDLYPEYAGDKKENKKVPDWVNAEEKEFKEKLDKNKDGVLDASEVYQWIVPEDFDHSIRETTHLFNLVDGDKDKTLSKDEIMKKWEILVGHQATDYGSFRHEEL